MKKILAIKGHSKRGKEIIKILEMFGGKNTILEGFDIHCFYYIDANTNLIRLGHTNYCNPKDFIIFTLEKFLEKYPYKVGDKVKYKKFHKHSDFIYIVKKMIWENNQIKYVIYNPCFNEYNFTLTAEDLQLYKEKIYTDCPINNNFNNSKPGLLIDGEKLIAPKGYTVKNATTNGNSLIVEYVKNKPQYPKNFEECRNLLSLGEDGYLYTKGYKASLMQDLQTLLICRNAYWKMAGEHMVLGKPWEPNWTVTDGMPAIFRFRYNIVCDSIKNQHCLLVFPTEEMRDAFFENFKDLIEECKEFL